MPNLRKQIEDLNKNLVSQLPADTLTAFAQAFDELSKSGIEKHAIRLGMKIPLFSMTNTKGQQVSSKDLLVKHDKIVLSFFRGTWCPYCNLELVALQKALNKFTDKNVALVGVSPQSVIHNTGIKDNNKLQFDILTDKDNAYAKQLGIDFELYDYLLPHYNKLGIDLKAFNENEDNSLPVPAVFVINKEGEITYSFVDPNYMNRVNIDELLANI